MKFIIASILGFLFSLGVIPVATFVFITSRGEYFYFITYKIMAIVLILVSFLFGYHTYFRLKENEKLFSHWKKYFVCGLITWLTTIIILAILNFTPLCIGQENGDGFNDIMLCILGTIGNAIFFTPGVLIGIALGSFLSASVYIKFFKLIK
jgi:hypothetical protein